VICLDFSLSQTALPEKQINHPQELQQVPGGSNPSRQGLDVRTLTSSTLPKATTTASDIGIELLQVLKNTTAYSSAGKLVRSTRCLKKILAAQHSELSITH
jgi:hypothetical protein